MSHSETPQPISVELDLRLANVHVTAGERADTIVRVRPERSAKRDNVTAARANTRRVRRRQAAGQATTPAQGMEPVHSVAGRSRSRSNSPPDPHLSGRTVAGEFHCTGSLGRCELKSGIGDITLERVTGDAELATGTGEVLAGEVDGSAVIRNSNGDFLNPDYA